MVTVHQIRQGLEQYLDTEILPHLPAMKRFGISVYIELLLQQIENQSGDFLEKPAIKILGLADENGNIDIEKLYGVAKNKFGSADRLEMDIPIAGRFVFNKSDVDNLFDMIRRS